MSSGIKCFRDHLGRAAATGLIVLGMGLANASAGDVTKPHDLLSAFGETRATNQDLLILNDGRRVPGLIANRSFKILTPYAEVALPAQALAGMDFSSSSGLHSVLTENSNLLSGILEESVFELAPGSPSGSRAFRREEISKAVFGRRPAMTNQWPRGMWITFRNGDQASATIVTDPIVWASTNGAVRFGAKELLRLAKIKPGMMMAWLEDGRALPGGFASEELRLRLDFGPSLQVARESIAAICREGSGSLPGSCQTNGMQAEQLAGMIWIPPGQFLMGSPQEERGRDPDEGPQTKVVVAKGFWIGKHEVTQAEYRRVIGKNPSMTADDPRQPVERVNWYEAVEYCRKATELAAKDGTLPEGYGYRLPTEAEWEYACRAGSTTRFCYGEDLQETQLGEYAWFARNSDSVTHIVGTRQPNAWGLYDMHGNVWEWCLDRWEGGLPGVTITNTPMFTQGNLRVARGGSWLYEAKSCRSANRDDYGPDNRCSDVGFRVVLAPLSSGL